MDKCPCKEDFQKVRDRCRVFKNGVTNKKARNLNLSNIKEKINNFPVNLGNSLSDSDQVIMSNLHDYVDYCKEGKNLEAQFYLESTGETGSRIFKDEPIYLYQQNVSHNPQLEEVITCPEFLGDWFDKHFPIYKKLVVHGSMHTWLFIGPKNTKSEMHTDHNHVHTTIQQLEGVKRFFLISSDQMRAIYFKTGSGDELFDPLEFSLTEDGKCEIKDIKGVTDLSFLKEVQLEYCDLHAGDFIYLPRRWGHYANSLTASLSVSRDFIDDQNIDFYFSSIILEHNLDNFFHTIDQNDLKKIYNEIRI